MDDPRESVIEKHLVDLVGKAGGLCPKFKSPGRANAPDRIVLLKPEKICFVECKKLGELPTDAQDREHARLRFLGFRVAVVDSMQKAETLVLQLLSE